MSGIGICGASFSPGEKVYGLVAADIVNSVVKPSGLGQMPKLKVLKTYHADTKPKARMK